MFRQIETVTAAALSLRHQRARYRPTVAAKLGDHLTRLALHRHVVEAAALAAMALAGLGDEAHAEPAGSQVGDLAMLGHMALIVGIAGERKGRIRQREDVAAMAEAMSVDHVVAHAHGE